ncbi:hypothetical protein KEM52_006021, partial [Ascosphaera acerosa]
MLPDRWPKPPSRDRSLLRPGIRNRRKDLTCWFWSRGACKFTETECGYAHRQTGRLARKPDTWTDYAWASRASGSRASHAGGAAARAVVGRTSSRSSSARTGTISRSTPSTRAAVGTGSGNGNASSPGTTPGAGEGGAEHLITFSDQEEHEVQGPGANGAANADVR